MDKKKYLVSGVMVLTVANIIVKLIGMVYKVALQHAIGDDGMGYFNCAYTIYDMFLIISTAGFPVAVSILVSKSRAGNNADNTKKIFRVATVFFLVIGAAGSVVIFLCSRLFASAIGNEASYVCIAAIAPVLFFVCMTSSLRGYFQGCQNMLPTAVSNVTEAAGKLVFGLLLAYYAKSMGYPLPTVAAFVIIGIVIAAFVGMLYMFATKLLVRERYEAADGSVRSDNLSVKRILKDLLATAIPITVSSSVLALTNVVDLGVVMRRLQSTGMSVEAANNLYGNYTGLVVPMFNLPPVLIYPIGVAIIPFISAARAQGNIGGARKASEAAIKAAAIVALPCALGLSVLSRPILSVFYAAESVEKAYPLLTVLALACFFLAISSVTNALLQAWGKERLPIISMIAGAVVKLVLSYILIGKIGIMGTPVSTLLCYFVIAFVNIIFVWKNTDVVPRILDTFLIPTLAASLCAGCAYFSHRLLLRFTHATVATLSAIVIAALVYFAVLLLLRAVKKSELELIPGGKLLSRVLEKMRVLK